MTCTCQGQMVPHDPVRGACTDEPADMPVGCGPITQRSVRAFFGLPPDPVVLAYDELDLRIMADMEGGH